MTRFSDFAGIEALRPDFPAGLSITRLNLDNVRRNWEYLVSLAKHFPPVAVIKGDAYGHGLDRVGRVLLDAGCRKFAVGSVNEGILLRKYLGNAGKEASILPLLGVVNEEDAKSAVEHNLLPLVGTADQGVLVSAAWSRAEPLPIVLKVDTGLSRLGFRANEVQHCVSAMRSFTNLRPSILLSHLAAADDPTRDESVAMQVTQYIAAYNAVREFWPDITLSFANTAAYLAQDYLLRDLPPHLPRSGYGLFGGNPLAGTSREYLGSMLLPTMETASPVTGVYDLAKGNTVSYGCTFTAEKDMRVAVVGAGYADGYSRGLSGKGHVCIRGQRCPVLGRICMQMNIVDVSHVPNAALGDAAFLLGGDGPGAISMDDLAADWRSIPHEALVLFGKNPRIYL